MATHFAAIIARLKPAGGTSPCKRPAAVKSKAQATKKGKTEKALRTRFNFKECVENMFTLGL